MEKKELLKLIRSGNFSIIYWDSQSPTYYKGNVDCDTDRDILDKAEIEFSLYGCNGYIPHIVEILVEALGGKSDSI